VGEEDHTIAGEYQADSGEEKLMPFDEILAGRIREALSQKKNIEEKRMFGCICFVMNGNALVGV
jgi:hypothetical protein